MRILFLSSWYPFPPDNGSKLRVFHLLRALGQKHRITLFAFTSSTDSEQVRQADFCERVQTVPGQPYHPANLKALFGFMSPIPRSLFASRSESMTRLVQSELMTQSYDLLLCSELATCVYGQDWRGSYKLLEDIEIGFFTNADQLGGIGLSARRQLTRLKLQNYLRRLLMDYDACTVVSQREKELFIEMGIPINKMQIVPNGVDADGLAQVTSEPLRNALVFNGALTYSANLDAMRYFLGDIYPLIRQQMPDIKLFITGRTDGVAADTLNLDENVTLTGYLNDVRPLVASSRVCIVPLRLGGGTRVKILEAMALGTPVVATSKGAEGLDVKHSEHLMIADEPSGFARYVCDLLSDEALRAHLILNARKLVCSHYDWATIGEQFERWLSSQVERSQG